MTTPSYKLTRYPVGSIREIWTISWPLILTMLSLSLMIFFDRLLLSRYSVIELNAASAAGTAAYTFLVLPISIAAISEVFVGRYHGEERHNELGKPVWQMFWFSLMLAPLYILLGKVAPFFLFYNSANIYEETLYFSTLLNFAPFFLANIGIAGFFIGTGRVRTATLAAVIGNGANIFFDYLLIYGYGPIPEMGIKGAALGTGLAEIIQFGLLAAIFLQKKYRIQYGTTKWRFNKLIFSESLRIGFPSGLGSTVEMISHFIFFRIMAHSGQENLTIAAIVQSIFFLVFFLYEGLSKGVTTVCANLLGAKQNHYIKKVIISAMLLQTFFFVGVSIILYFSSRDIIDFFLNKNDEAHILTPHFLNYINWGLFWMSLFFLFDGFTRIFAGHFTAAGDTKFLLYAGTVLNVAAYVLPLLLIVYYIGGGADDGWMIIFCYSLTTFLVYLWRYLSNKWVASSKALDSDNTVL